MSKRRRGKPIKKKAKYFTKKRVIIGSVSLLALIAVIFSYLYVTQIVIPTNIAKTQPLSILIVGTDESEYREGLWDDDEKATLTDSLMVLTFNPNRYRFEVTSIPRDTSVDYVCDSLPDYQDQINEVYYLSGYDINCLQDTVSNFLNVPIDYHVIMNFDEFSDIVDEIGGVDITAHAADGVLTQVNELTTETYTWVDGEEYHMSGDEALSYSRARHDSEKDYGRGLRQQQVVAATLKQALTSDISLDLISKIFNMVETDIPPKIGYDYYNFLSTTNEIAATLMSDSTVDVNVMPDSAWKYMFEWFEYPDSSGSVNQDKVNDFQNYLKENYEPDEVTQYFFRQHQFFNEAYSGHYNVVEEQLQEISDALRENLELSQEEVKVPSKDYGDNEASGLIPTEWAGSSENYGSEVPENYTPDEEDDHSSENTQTTEPETTEPETTEPETTEPETTDPDTTDPDTTDPDTTDPDTTDPDTTDPDTTDPDTSGNGNGNSNSNTKPVS